MQRQAEEAEAQAARASEQKAVADKNSAKAKNKKAETEGASQNAFKEGPVEGREGCKEGNKNLEGYAVHETDSWIKKIRRPKTEEPMPETTIEVVSRLEQRKAQILQWADSKEEVKLFYQWLQDNDPFEGSVGQELQKAVGCQKDRQELLKMWILVARARMDALSIS